ncbi:hypothetical protein HOLleu_27106 [Holothuria leucospilota]|uniref:Uncharacterized protein n=1 Tax=Holothuria leucospilota TaxID=206669 RepID=A0A9Q1BQ31_HOLLE|nr:hypothetical protein HOLleu_27106 [Holothuria leucospilota]
MVKTLSLVVLIFGKDKVFSQDCCVADQFSIGLAKSVHWIFNSSRSHLTRVRGHAAMDYTGHRYALNYIGEDFGEKRSWKTSIIKLYNKHTLYMIVDDTRCFKHSLRGKEPQQCVPEGAHLDDSIFFGKRSLPVNSWKMIVHHHESYYGDLRFATTQTNCIPVAFSLMARLQRKSGNYDHHVQDGVFFNFTTGVEPSFFTVPDICKHPIQKLKRNTEEWFGIFFGEELFFLNSF